MANLFGSADYQDLPVMTAKQVSKYYHANVDPTNIPARYLMETDDFLMHFNTRDTPLPPAEPLTRSTLQFYSSPRVRLFPLPVYRNRHTAHYIVPDHFNRLAVICIMRDKFFMPIKMIHKLVELLPEDNYRFLERWPGTVQGLMEAVQLLKRGFKEEDLLSFAALRSLIFLQTPPEAQRNTLEGFGADEDKHLKSFLRGAIAKNAGRLEEWVTAQSGASCVKTLGQTLGDFSTPLEYQQKMIGRKKDFEKSVKERLEKPRMHPR
ncbi:MAG: hypothetical protein KGO96_01035 [Elusimicrobia bacterium]|nr:hypothetical protein [Elusimicrobiota bacterium]MDE2237609.1 hypothetical protein [Elusimicrobiota bacterium]MDE2424480.1 hypothetical protein [Elusimicrobiota bacterium]